MRSLDKQQYKLIFDYAHGEKRQEMEEFALWFDSSHQIEKLKTIFFRSKNLHIYSVQYCFKLRIKKFINIDLPKGVGVVGG